MNSILIENLESWSSFQKEKSSAGRGKSKGYESSGIIKLKELILYFAFRGRLLEQVKNEGSGTDLLESLKMEVNSLMDSGDIKKRKGHKNKDEVLPVFEVPSHWAWARLGDICYKLTDGSHNPPKNAGEGIPMLSSQNVKEGEVDFTNPSRFVTEEQFEAEDKRTQIKEGDVLLTIVASLGRSAVVPSNSPSFALQRSVAVVDTGMNPYFLSLLLESPLCRSYYDTHAKGTAQKGIYLGKLSQMPIVIPPLKEQHRIVSKVKELFGYCDELEMRVCKMNSIHNSCVDTYLNSMLMKSDINDFYGSWEHIAESFEFLFSTISSVGKLENLILNLAISGKLKTQNENDKPAHFLLDQLSEKRKYFVESGKIKKQKKLKEVSDDEKDFNLPSGWEWARLQDVLDVRDGTHDSPKTLPEGGIPLVTSKDFKNNCIDFDNAKRISKEDHEEIAKRSLVEVGDILFSMIGGNIGNQVVVRDPRPFSIKNVALFKYYDQKLTSPDFIKIYLENLAVTLQEKAKGGAQPFFGLGAFRNLVIALPPFEEQLRIVKHVRLLLKYADDLKISISQLDSDKDAMLNSIDNIIDLDQGL